MNKLKALWANVQSKVERSAHIKTILLLSVIAVLVMFAAVFPKPAFFTFLAVMVAVIYSLVYHGFKEMNGDD